MYRIDRKEFIQEIMLREHISKSLQKRIVEARRESNKNNMRLRKVISSLIREAEEADKAPHRSTGINVLADVLKKIVPVLEQDYKALTTDPTQRESFRAHIINAAQNAIAPVSASGEADAEDTDSEPELSDGEVAELEEIEVVMGDDAEALEDEEEIVADAGEDDELDTSDDSDLGDDAFIDIDDAQPEEEDNFGIEGKDDTGRNFAQASFDKIEKQIIDAYALLGNDEDKELFYKYLVTNLKLYFDKFEDELASVLPEPTTSEYEDEKEQQDEEPDEGDDDLDLGDDDLGGDDLGGDGEEELEL
tara:strand:+ start:2362 stop:3276 length:915 start_codon:yes stop_codon:yes gene_type:complete